MTNNTEIYWEANGLSLHTLAWSVSTFGGRRYAPAPKRGSDLVLPLRQGQRFVPKVRDSQQLSLAMWCVPLQPNGLPDPDLTLEQRLHKNWQTIVDAVDVPGQFDLKKRWWAEDQVMEATARAEFLEGLEPEMAGGYRAEFSLDLFLADPYFYGDEATNAGGAFTALGDAATDRVEITVNVTGNARIDFSDGNYLIYAKPGGGTPAGTLVIDAYTGIVKKSGVPINGWISRNKNFGSYALITPGSYEVEFTSGITSGLVKYYPAYR